MGSKGQVRQVARGPPESAEGRSSGNGEGECFAPFIFHLKIIVFCVKMVFFWSKNGSGLIWDNLQKNIHQNFDICFDTFPDHFESSRGPIELILSQLKALV